jgi:hypothetical protein
MSHSVPSDSSAIDATFLVGIDLVEFDRRELPIYASPQTRWMDACYEDAPSYGAPVDRVFGNPALLMSGPTPRSGRLPAATAMPAEDPPSPWRPADGLILPAPNRQAGRALSKTAMPALPSGAQQAPEIVTIFDFGLDPSPRSI